MKTLNINKRWYINVSDYDVAEQQVMELIKKHVKLGDVSYPRFANHYGWNNQPKVVTFNCQHTKEYLDTYVLPTLLEALGEWVSIRKKEW